MQTSLDAYLLKLDGWLDPGLCGEAIAELETAAWRKHGYTRKGGENLPSAMEEQEFDITFADELSFDAAIARKMAMAVEYYVVRLQFPWFSPTRNRTAVRYNSYAPMQRMTEHCDHINLEGHSNSPKPILSCLSILNDDYEGGQFVMWGDKVIDTPVGTTLVFLPIFYFHTGSSRCFETADTPA